MRRALAILATLAALALASVAAAAPVQLDTDTIYGWPASGNTIRLDYDSTGRTTTGFAIGAWTSHPGPLPVEWTMTTDCRLNINDRVSTGSFMASSTMAGSALAFTASPLAGSPWAGWDTCAVSVLISSPLDPGDSMVAWLVSHE